MAARRARTENRQRIGFVASGWCTSPNIDFTAPAGAVVAGTNVLAFRGTELDGGGYLDLTVTYGEG